MLRKIYIALYERNYKNKFNLKERETMKKSVFIIMLILVAVLSVCGNRNGGVKLTDEQLAERFVED